MVFNRNAYLLLVCWGGFFCCGRVLAQDIQQIREISFGIVVVADNNSSGGLEIDSLGNITVDENFYVVEPGLHGVFRITGFIPNARLFLSHIITHPTTQSTLFSPEQFTLTSLNIVPSIRVDSSGNADIRVGGRLETSGSGSSVFANTDFTSRFSITVNY